MKLSAFLSLVLSAALTLLVWGQSASGQRDQKMVVGTAEVQLDVIVKDKKGRPVKDLKASDFEISEDGVKQTVESFRLVTRPNASANKTAETKTEAPVAAVTKTNTAAPPRDAETSVSAVALVYDRLSAESRKRAHDAAQSYVGAGTVQENYVGVFQINLGVSTLQNFTTNTELIRRAVDRAGLAATAGFDAPGGAVKDGTTQLQAISSAASAAASGGSGAGAAAGGAAAGAAGVDAQFAAMEERIKETMDVLQRDQQGYATANGLLAVVNSMKRLPGRKAIIFFAEGVSIPPNVQKQFQSVIANANKANVSFYAVDTAGLRAESANKIAGDEIRSRANRRMEQAHSGRPDLSGPMTANLERNEDILNFNPQNGMMQLAAETGGQFIGDTNNIAPKLKQIDEDLNTYYMLTYAPTNASYDGKFRNIAVKVNQSGLDVQSRKGYFAVNPTGSSPILSYEAPALVLLNNPSPPTAFPLQAAGLNFPEATKLGRTSISVQAAANSFTFLEGKDDKEKKSFTTNFSIVVLIKDQAKQVVSKLSQNYVLAGPIEKMAALKNQNILFYRETDLPPGKFDVEVVAFDTPSNKASVKRTTIEVPDADETVLRMSSVSLINRIEQLKEKMESPFVIGDLMVYPNLGDPVKKSAQKLGFYFTVYPAAGKADATKLTLELTSNGKSLANFPLKLSAPDASGKIQFASALPLESLNPGEYQLKFTVKDDKTTASRSTSFLLQP